jgi:A/G-specific adenine glycosylase
MLDSDALRRELLQWWDSNKVDLPWRHTRDPYAIWVAEIMLQQTQIVTVIPYYLRWLERFPNVQLLANASLNDVLKAWEGLGYYSRARNLHTAAQTVVSKFEGQIPNNVDQLLKLKGIGRYTAGAIASIAFSQPVPVLDGNVIRVLSRLYDLDADVSTTATKNDLWQIAGELVPAKRPGEFNQALMELGQRVCLPVAPQCRQCPLYKSCLAWKHGTQLERPIRPPRRRVPHYDMTAGIIKGEDDRFLITRRPLDGLLGGLWGFPGGRKKGDENLPDALIRQICGTLGIKIEIEGSLTTVKHAYTHFRITLHAFNARFIGGQPSNYGVSDHAWVHLEDVEQFAIARTDRKIIDHLWTIRDGLA